MRNRAKIISITLIILSLPILASAMTALGSVQTSALTKDIFLMENFAIVAEGEYGVEIFDVSDPGNPFLAETIETPGSADGVYVYGEIIFIADGEAGFSAYYFNTYEAEAYHVNTVDTPGFCTDIMVSCDIAYVADGSEGMHTYHAYDAEQLDYLNSYDTPGYATNIFGPCGDINLADGSSGFRFYGVDGPFDLVYVGGYDSDVSTVSLFPVDNHVYVADSTGGLLVIDRTDINNQFLAASYATPGTAFDVFWHWEGFLYVAAGDAGILQYDATEPTDLVYLDVLETSEPAIGIKMWNNYAYVITNNSLISFEQITTGIDDDIVLIPESFELVRNYPNPFNASTTISFALAAPGDIQIDIYDLQGRHIETVAKGDYAAGEHNLIWNAESFSSGVYFYRLSGNGSVYTSKMTLLK